MAKFDLHYLDSPYDVFSDVCNRCVHLDEEAFYQDDHRCAAFTEEIPPEIWNGERSHVIPYPGDNGIRFMARQEDGGERLSQ